VSRYISSEDVLPAALAILATVVVFVIMKKIGF